MCPAREGVKDGTVFRHRVPTTMKGSFIVIQILALHELEVDQERTDAFPCFSVAWSTMHMTEAATPGE